jgi:uncharacterized protein YjiS (DUF1127 family)
MRPTEDAMARPIDGPGPRGGPPASAIDRRLMIKVVGHFATVVRRLIGAIIGFDGTRHARAQMHAWAALDNRVLADIGVRRADVQAVLLGIVPAAQLHPRSESAIVAGPSAGCPVVSPARGQVLALATAAQLNAAA